MKILIVSKEGDGAGVAYRLMTEGHDVHLWIKDNKYKDALRGIVNRPPAWKPMVRDSDLIICDMVGFSQYEDLFKRLGKPTLSCNKIADMLELDRSKGMAVFKRLGINTPTSQTFKNIQEAEGLEWKNEAGYVVKASGNLDTGKTYVCDSEEIYKWALSTMAGATDIVVQDRIPKEGSVEISTEGWFNGRDFVKPFNHTWEEKRLMAGDIGKMTGCMGNVVMAFQRPTYLAECTVMRFKPLLERMEYRGPIDVNCIVTKDKIYALEFTMRMGYDAVEALMTGLNEPMGAFLYEMALGTKISMDIRSDFLLAIRVTRDPYPYAEPHEIEESDKGMPISGLTETDMKFVYLCDVMKKDGQLQYAASDGVLLKATSFGRSVKEAQSRAYKICKNVEAIDIAYRNDIGDRVEKNLDSLRAWGWI